MKRFVGCPQISRLKTERNYWDDAAGGIKASTASRLWQRGVRGGTDQGCRMLLLCVQLGAAGRCCIIISQRMHWKQMHPVPNFLGFSAQNRGLRWREEDGDGRSPSWWLDPEKCVMGFTAALQQWRREGFVLVESLHPFQLRTQLSP